MDGFLQIYILVAAGLGIFLSFILFIKRNTATTIVSFIILLLSFELIARHIDIMKENELATAVKMMDIGFVQGLLDYRSPYLNKNQYTVAFLFFPLIFIYIRIITGSARSFLGEVKRLIPAFTVLSAIYLFMNFTVIDAVPWPDFILYGKRNVIYRFILTTNGIKYLIILCYLVFSYAAVRRYTPDEVRQTDDPAGMKRNWLRAILAILTLMFVSALTGDLCYIIAPTVSEAGLDIYHVLLSVVIIAAGYFATVRPDRWVSIHGMQSSGATEEGKRERYRKNVIPDQTKREYLTRILRAIEEKKLYLDPDFSLNELSDSTGIPAHTISQVINEKLAMNLYSLINKYRAGFAMDILKKERGVSIIAVCYRSGFNSKSTFNKTFRKIFGCTPSDFIDRQDSVPGL